LYLNNKGDKHYTLDKSLYQKDPTQFILAVGRSGNVLKMNKYAV
jgi:hypothetical protein